MLCFMVIIEENLTLNLKRLRQIDNEQYKYHTDPCTVNV